MLSSILYAVTLAAGFTSAAPASKRDFSPDNVYFPLANHFPNPSQDEIAKIELDAHGILPNGPPPPTLSPEGITNLQLIALNELFEVAYFTELVYNVTNKLPGYDLGYGHEYVLDALSSIVAQEELHLLNANGALKHFKVAPIEPCKYSFPVTDFQSAVALAQTFTDLVLGTLQEVNQIFAENGDFGLVRAVSSVIGNEAEQNGLYRLIQSKRPSSQAFLTTATRRFAFTAIQSFTIPNSCTNIGTISLKAFKGLTVESTNLKPVTQNIKFSFTNQPGLYATDTLKLVYINGQNTPVVKLLQKVQIVGDKLSFEAAFPYDEFVMSGLTIAAVTVGKDSFANADEVAAATIYGPGLIELD
jgi:hypothetical protein